MGRYELTDFEWKANRTTPFGAALRALTNVAY